MLIGNLTRDPELKQSEGKKPVCIIGLATNRSWIDQNGEKHEEKEYHRIVAWDKLGEKCHQYLRKGRKIWARGRLQYRTYTGQDGMEKFSAEIVLEKMEFLDSTPQDVKETLNGAAVQQVQ